MSSVHDGWSLESKERPFNFIQWKGTDVCMDFYCVCEKQFHIDDYFAYAVQCPHCEKKYELKSRVEVRDLPEDWNGCEPIRGNP
jgi:hypothetical protein